MKPIRAMLLPKCPYNDMSRSKIKIMGQLLMKNIHLKTLWRGIRSIYCRCILLSPLES
jgi:hypothetical protein